MLSEKRRWHQFSLRCVIVTSVALSCGLGMFEIKRRNVIKRREAVSEINASGGRVTFEHQIFGTPPPGSWIFRRLFGSDVSFVSHYIIVAECNSTGPDIDVLKLFPEVKVVTLSHPGIISEASWRVLGDLPAVESLSIRDPPSSTNFAGIGQVEGLRHLSLIGPSVTDQALPAVSSLRNLESLTLARTHITDAGLQHLSRLPRLNSLNLNSIGITGSGLFHLATIKTVEELSLSGSSITNAHLTWLESFPRLRRLDLVGTPITDDALSVVARLPSITQLNVSGTLVTDSGLVTLADVSSLELLEISQTNVTAEGVRQFLKKKPACKVVR